MSKKKLAFVYASLHFDLHAQVEYYLLPYFEKAGYDMRIIICDNSYNSSTEHLIVSDCENHDHWSLSQKKHYNKNIIDQVCKMCSMGKARFYDKIDLSKIIPSSILLSDHEHLISKANWKNRHSLYEEINLPNFKINDDHVLSSLYTRHRASSLRELSMMYLGPNELSMSLNAALKYYLSGAMSAKTIVATYGKPEFFLMFNGRFGAMSGIKDALKSYNIPTLIHERGYTEGSFCFSKNFDPGDPFSSYKYWMDLDSSIGSKSNMTADNKELEKVSVYFEDKRLGKRNNGHIFAGNKSPESTSTYMQTKNNSQPYVTLFTSSSDEISSYSKFAKFSTQIELFKALVKMTSFNNYRLVVRQHPNLGLIGRTRVASQFLESFKNIATSFQHVDIINPDSNIDTYEIAVSSEFNFCPQTSLFFEMVDLGYPVIQIKESPYGILIKDPMSISSIEKSNILELKKASSSIMNQRDYIMYFAYKHFIKSSICFEGCKIVNSFKASEKHQMNIFDSKCDQLIANQLLNFASSSGKGYFHI